MDEEKDVKLRLCTDCVEHSGMTRTSEMHGKILTHLIEKMDKFMEDSHRHRTQMLVGIILCLSAGLLSVYFSYEAQQTSRPKSYIDYFPYAGPNPQIELYTEVLGADYLYERRCDEEQSD